MRNYFSFNQCKCTSFYESCRCKIEYERGRSNERTNHYVRRSIFGFEGFEEGLEKENVFEIVYNYIFFYQNRNKIST